MKIIFSEARDLGRHGTVAAGETRSDLPTEYARLQVQYGFATEVTATAGKPKKTNQEE